MIRKLGIALLLVAAGLGVMHVTIGFENFASVDDGHADEPIKRTRDERGLGGGVKVGGGDRDTPEISVSGSGEFQVDRREERVLANGDRMFLPVYQLVAEDSETLADDLVRLDSVTVRVFRIEEEPEPTAVQIGTITARQAFVQLGRGEDGRPSVREDRDMDLRDVVLESTPAARVQGLRLVVARLHVRQAEQGVDFRTPTETEPFSLTLLGEAPTSLEGLGVRGILPRDGGREGGVLEVHVNSRPVLVRGDVRVSSQGPLDYVEDTGAGIGDVALFEEVELVGVPGEATSEPTTARGDRLIGRLLRYRQADAADPEGRGQRASWLGIRLDGEPATVVNGGLGLSCRTLFVRPTFGGVPAAFVAEGAPELTEPGSARRFRAAERIHVVDVRRYLAPVHSRFGFPDPYFGRLAGQLIVFEGSATIVDPEQGLELDAGDGLRMLRALDDSEVALVVGAGRVDIRGEDLTASGPDGFVLRQNGDARSVRLGPREPDPSHAFELAQTAADGALRVRGHGACRLDQLADGSARVALESPTEDLELERGTDSLRAARTLDAAITSDGRLSGFRAEGQRCEIDTVLPAQQGGAPERIGGVARSITSVDGRSLGLRGTPDTPAVIERADGSRVEGNAIDAWSAGHRRGLVVARGAPAFARVPVTGEGDARLVELRSGTIRLLPGLVPRPLVAWHGLDPRWATAVASELVVADGAVDLRAYDAEGRPMSTATGQHLTVRLRDGAGILRGAPAVAASDTADGRRVVARAPALRIRGGDFSAQRAVLLPEEDAGPELDVYERGTDSAFRAFRIACLVPMVADDVGVRIDGPARVRALTDRGEVDPDGVALDADALELTWLDDSRSVDQVVADGSARMTYRGLLVFGDEMRIDVPRTEVRVERKADGSAGFVLRGLRLQGALFLVDYEAQELRAWGPLEGRGR